MKNIKHIYFISSVMPPDRGGGAFTRLQQINQINSAGYKINLISMRPADVASALSKAFVIPHSASFFDRLLTKIRVYPDTLFRWAFKVSNFLIGCLKTDDLVFITSGGELSICLIAFILRLRGFRGKIVLNLHDLPDHSIYMKSSPLFDKFWVYQLLELIAYKSCDLLLCNSRAMINLIKNKYPKLGTRIDFFYFGYEDDRQASLNAGMPKKNRISSQINIGAIGTMNELQAPGFLVGCLSKYSYDNDWKFKLIFIGSLPTDEQVDSTIIGSEPYMDRKSLVNYADQNLDIGFLSLMDKPVFKCAMPTKFYEYLNLGIPILATMPNNSEVGNLITTHGLGWVVRHGDLMGLIEVLNHLKNSPEEICSAAQNVRNIRSKFKREITQKKMLDSLAPLCKLKL